MNWLISQLDVIVQQIAAVSRRLWPMGTWANRPVNSLLGLYLATDIGGGTLFRDNGTRWGTVSGAITLANQNTTVTVGATSANVGVLTFAIPAGLFGPNDQLEIEVVARRTATGSTRLRVFGGGDGSFNGQLIATRADGASASGYVSAKFVIKGRNAVNAQLGDPTGSIGLFASAELLTTVDFSVSQNIYVAAQKDVAADPYSILSVVAVYKRGV